MGGESNQEALPMALGKEIQAGVNGALKAFTIVAWTRTQVTEVEVARNG